jgi:hypothetical protein
VVQILSVKSSLKYSHGTTAVINIEWAVITHGLYMISSPNPKLFIVKNNLYQTQGSLYTVLNHMVYFLLSIQFFQEGFLHSSQVWDVFRAPWVLYSDESHRHYMVPSCTTCKKVFFFGSNAANLEN